MVDAEDERAAVLAAGAEGMVVDHAEPIRLPYIPLPPSDTAPISEKLDLPPVTMPTPDRPPKPRIPDPALSVKRGISVVLLGFAGVVALLAGFGAMGSYDPDDHVLGLGGMIFGCTLLLLAGLITLIGYVRELVHQLARMHKDRELNS